MTSLKPDQQKTSTEQAGDTVKGKADSTASSLQPEVRGSNCRHRRPLIS